MLVDYDQNVSQHFGFRKASSIEVDALRNPPPDHVKERRSRSWASRAYVQSKLRLTSQGVARLLPGNFELRNFFPRKDSREAEGIERILQTLTIVK